MKIGIAKMMVQIVAPKAISWNVDASSPSKTPPRMSPTTAAKAMIPPEIAETPSPNRRLSRRSSVWR